MAAAPSLNERAQRIADHLIAQATAMRVAVHTVDGGARVIDCGVKAEGGLQAGLAMARACTAGQAEISLAPGDVAGLPFPVVQVATDFPVAACMQSQYAGWQISVGDFFGMGSGPMRAVYGKEAIFDHIGGREKPPVAVGVVETRQVPDAKVLNSLAQSMQVPVGKITLLVAPCPSMAGNLQVVARSIETALHKLHALKFDIKQIVSAFGSAPLPPVGKDDLEAIGRTNDAILYGGRVNLWVRGDDKQIAEIGKNVPSSSSRDYGAPFAQIFAKHGQDFYKLDPGLFSPAQVVFHNLKTGKSHAFGKIDPSVLQKSFLG